MTRIPILYNTSKIRLKEVASFIFQLTQISIFSDHDIISKSIFINILCYYWFFFIFWKAKIFNDIIIIQEVWKLFSSIMPISVEQWRAVIGAFFSCCTFTESSSGCWENSLQITSEYEFMNTLILFGIQLFFCCYNDFNLNLFVVFFNFFLLTISLQLFLNYYINVC